MHDGTTVEYTYTPGETRHETYGPGEFKVHDLENLGDKEMVFMTIEFLQSANKPMPLPQACGRRPPRKRRQLRLHGGVTDNRPCHLGVRGVRASQAHPSCTLARKATPGLRARMDEKIRWRDRTAGDRGLGGLQLTMIRS